MGSSKVGESGGERGVFRIAEGGKGEEGRQGGSTRGKVGEEDRMHSRCIESYGGGEGEMFE